MTLQEYKNQKMQNPDFSAAYDEIQLNITGTFTPLVRIEETIVPD